MGRGGGGGRRLRVDIGQPAFDARRVKFIPICRHKKTDACRPHPSSNQPLRISNLSLSQNQSIQSKLNPISDPSSVQPRVPARPAPSARFYRHIELARPRRRHVRSDAAGTDTDHVRRGHVTRSTAQSRPPRDLASVRQPGAVRATLTYCVSVRGAL